MSLIFSRSGEGYATVRDGVDGEVVQIHRLSAVAKHGYGEVSDATDVHHIDGVRVNNARENLLPVDSEEHRCWNLNGHPNGGRASHD